MGEPTLLMSAHLSKVIPPASQAAPTAATREQGLRTLQLELENQSDSLHKALLHHEIARVHERREDLTSAAREELAATQCAEDFIEPIESLLDIATRGRSKTNSIKLLDRLKRVALTSEGQVRAFLALALTLAAEEKVIDAIAILEEGLNEVPTDPSLWLALEAMASLEGNLLLARKAATGRAAHARNSDLRCLLLERVARLEMSAGNAGAAYASLGQSVDELPSLRALQLWEDLATTAKDYAEAGRVAIQTATILRGALEDTGEANLYKIPHDELTEERANAAQIRAIICALLEKNLEEAIELAQALVEVSPLSPLAQSLHYQLLLRSLNEGGTHNQSTWECLQSLLELRSEDNDEKTYLLSNAVLISQSLDQEGSALEEDRSRLLEALEGLKVHASKSALSELHDWLGAEKSGSAAKLSSLFLKWLHDSHSQSSEKVRPTHKSGSLALATVVTLVVASKYDEAEKVIEEEGPALDTFGLVLGRLIASLKNDALKYAELTHRLADILDDPQEQKALDWESLRFALSRGDDLQQAPIASTPWTSLAITFLQLADRFPRASGPTVTTAIDSSTSLVEEVYRYVGQQKPSAEFERALFASALAHTGDTGDLLKLWKKSPSDPLLAGALIQRYSDIQSTELDEVRVLSARGLDDEVQKSSWYIKSAASYLRAGKTHQALETLSISANLHTDILEELEHWFSLEEKANSPAQKFKHLDSLEQIPDERHLEYSALTWKLSPDSLATRWQESEESGEPGIEAEQILQVLSAATSKSTSLSHALSRTELFQPVQRAALSLARTFDESEQEELLQASESWARISDNSAALLTQWVAARRCNNRDMQARVMLLLARTPQLAPLLASVDLESLNPDELETHRDALLSNFETTENKAEVAWAILEMGDDRVSEQNAKNILRLSDALDTPLEDVEGQTAILAAGFQYLNLGAPGQALELFESLLPHIPTDLTLCHGLCLAAAHENRPDIEAAASCTLAQNTSDNHDAARLWERAGLLYQDDLEDAARAEECFTSALNRVPGSAFAFERVYRIARSRSDRARQIELIDDRLDTADSESLKIELNWEKARYCHILGRRALAWHALEEVLALSPEHLPALALAAEVHLVDGRLEPAATTLRSIALHPETPQAQRRSAGLIACDLFEKLRRPGDAVTLLQTLSQWGPTGIAELERMARALARSENWGDAYKAFSRLNHDQDTIETRLESARMMLAIQRDHLRDPAEWKEAARCVLRDAPRDADGVRAVLELDFSTEERQVLLKEEREQSRESLQRTPLHPEEIAHFAMLCTNCEDEGLERIALGNLQLVGKLSSELQTRLETLRTHCPPLPCNPWSVRDLEVLAAQGQLETDEHPAVAGQLGSTGAYARIIAPHIAAQLEPSLEALGVSSLMRIDEFSNSEHRAEVGTWVGAFRDGDFELYIGGDDPDCIRALEGDLPTILLGKGIVSPLSRTNQARLVSQLSALHHRTVAFLNHPTELSQKWLFASEVIAGNQPDEDPEVAEMARTLSQSISREEREELVRLSCELAKAGVNISSAPFGTLLGSARAAVLAFGDASILRQLPELLPPDERRRNGVMADVLRFVLTEEFFALRNRAGLELA